MRVKLIINILTVMFHGNCNFQHKPKTQTQRRPHAIAVKTLQDAVTCNINTCITVVQSVTKETTERPSR